MLIVGSGLAGLALARDLAEAGRKVRLLDKSRGVGGRTATRRWQGRVLDHGAQFFTARGDRLSSLVNRWQSEGWLRVWTRGFGQYKAGEFVEPREDGHARYAPLEGMSALGKRLSSGLNIRLETQIVRAEHKNGLWTLTDADGQRYTDPEVVFNLPAPQLVTLLRGETSTEELHAGHPLEEPLQSAASLEKVRLSPTFSLLLALEQDLNVPWKAAQSADHPIGFVSRDHTKRPDGAPPTLVVHAGAMWSGEHLEGDFGTVAREMLEHLEAMLQVKLAVGAQQLHRWRYATPEIFYPDACHWDPALGLGWCGDWCGAAKVEGALSSGWALAERILGREEGEGKREEGALEVVEGARAG